MGGANRGERIEVREGRIEVWEGRIEVREGRIEVWEGNRHLRYREQALEAAARPGGEGRAHQQASPAGERRQGEDPGEPQYPFVEAVGRRLEGQQSLGGLVPARPGASTERHPGGQ